jgi:prefoldin subunit 5
MPYDNCLTFGGGPMTKAARSLRRRKAKLDSSIARVKRKVKSLTKQLKTQQRMLSKREARRRKLK